VAALTYWFGRQEEHPVLKSPVSTISKVHFSFFYSFIFVKFLLGFVQHTNLASYHIVLSYHIHRYHRRQ